MGKVTDGGWVPRGRSDVQRLVDDVFRPQAEASSESGEEEKPEQSDEIDVSEN